MVDHNSSMACIPGGFQWQLEQNWPSLILSSLQEVVMDAYIRKEEENMTHKISILGFAGSLRKGSYNKSLLRVALEMVPADAKLEIFDLEGIPPFNQDLENQPPEKVKEFKAKIRAADAILIATPEYNYSIPGVLKNAIDNASRPYGDNPFNGKPVAIMGASIGMLGTARAQYHLRQSLVFLNMYPLNQPEVMVPFAQEKIDQNGLVTDQKTRKKIRELVEALVIWTRKLKKD
jgi:chromate reductase